MLKILNTAQIREWDAYTIKNEPIASIDLMERACDAFVKWFVKQFNSSKTVSVVCGTGNNGGDGLGIARMLTELEYRVEVWIVKGAGQESEDFKINQKHLPQTIELKEINDSSSLKNFTRCDILVDAIFGSGLSRPVEGIYTKLIEAVNNNKSVRIAIDIPSGLFADKHTKGIVVRADYTVTFQLPKLAFLLPENEEFVGQWTKADIGLSKAYLSKIDASEFYVTRKSIAKQIKHRNTFSHKGNYGRALLVAGSYGKMGACVLSAKAAMRSGLGLLTVHIPKEGYTTLQTAVPEAMVSVDSEAEYFSWIDETESYSVIGIGPGLGQQEQTAKALSHVLEQSSKPMVIDADGLNILAANRELLHLIPDQSILTPHLGEFERLVGPSENGFERLEKAKSFSSQTNTIIVLKGAYSTIVTPEGKIYFNSTGNPGMATGGSGDVLTGIIMGLMAQSYLPTEAAVIGVYLHGLSGDIAVSEKGRNSLIATDIVEFLPKAFKKVSN